MKKTKTKVKICAECGHEFVPTNGKQKYCDKQCANKHFNNMRGEYNSNGRYKAHMRHVMNQFTKSKAFDIEAEQRKVGSSYAEYQKQKTLQLIAEGKL